MQRVTIEQMRDNMRDPWLHWGRGPNGEAGPKPEHASRRLSEKRLAVRVEPGIRLNQPKVFAMGSCFAREIEAGFQSRGLEVLSVPRTLVDHPLAQLETKNNNRGLLNRYNTPSMELEFRNLLVGDALADDELVDHEPNRGFHDMHYYALPAAESLAIIGERRAMIRRELQGLREADMVIITLGLAEACFDLTAQKYRNQSPTISEIRRKVPLEVHLSSYEDTLASLERIRTLIRTHCVNNPTFIVTVSPVPLTVSYLPGDAIINNTLAKATLRAAAGAFVEMHDDVIYFPSYEMVTLSDRKYAFRADQRHVHRRMVAAIVRTFLTAFGLATREELGDEGDDEGEGEGDVTTD